MAENNLFYKYYDLLYATKNYQQEVDAVFKISSKFNLNKIKKALEIGCGTANHTLCFAKEVASITSCDIDKHMLEIAKEKIQNSEFTNIELCEGYVQKITQNNFDLAVALFNVVNYIPTQQSLDEFFGSIRSKITQESLFIFDSWNGKACLQELPQTKIIDQQKGNKRIHCLVEGSTDFKKRITKLTYTISLFLIDGKKLEEDRYCINQTLWLPNEIQRLLKKNGFNVLEINQLFQVDAKADLDKDWKIMFICRPY